MIEPNVVEGTDQDKKQGLVLEVRDLHTYFRVGGGVIRAVDGVSFDIKAGTALGIVGESGSGKSVASLSIMRLVQAPGYIAHGEILFRGRDLAKLDEQEIRRMRGKQLCLVFQDPMSALNPVYKVGAQVMEQILAHNVISKHEARQRVIELFRKVGISDPEHRVDEYPHNLSGGMRQRVVIAMALANNPDLLILDEPTTALDVTIQAQILDLVKELKNSTVLLITHDIGVIQEICDEVVVMYGGRVMERGMVDQVIGRPKHPYTVGLLASMPSAGKRGNRLKAIAGTVPNPLKMPPGCPFQPRCTMAVSACSSMPPLKDTGDGQHAACWLV